MLETFIRPNYQRFFADPLARLFLHKAKPNTVTIAAIIIGILSAVCFIYDYRYLAIVLLALSGLCDSLDGTVARLTGQSSSAGAMLDIVGDRIVEFVIIFSFYLYNPSRNGLGAFLMLGASYLCVTTFLVVGIFEKNVTSKSFYYSVGLFERAEAFVMFAIMMLWPLTIAWLAWIYFVLVIYTTSVRMLQFMRAH